MYYVVFTSGNKNVELYLLKRMALERDIAGCCSLLGRMYVIFKNSEKMLRYAGCRPYKLQKTWVIKGMNPIDIATNYASICVYILDANNRCVWCIQREGEPRAVLKFSEEIDLVRMSVTERGKITIVWNKTKISVYSDAGTKLLSTEIQPKNTVNLIVHAIEVEDGSFIGCNDRQLFKLSANGKVTKVNKEMGGSYIVQRCTENRSVPKQSDNTDVVVVCQQTHHVEVIDHNTLELKNTLLTIQRDGIESPQHVFFALDSGLLLVSWLNYVDVYSFNESDLHSHLAANEQETRDQRVAERAVLEVEVFRNKQYQILVHDAEKLTPYQQSTVSGRRLCTVLGFVTLGKHMRHFWHIRRRDLSALLLIIFSVYR